MRIESAEVVVTSPGRNFTTLRIVTEDGVTGLGDATLNGRELAVASYLRDHVVPLLLDRDASRIEDTWQYLYRGAYWRRGPVTMAAIAAVDTALWDIKAKAAGMPLYQLLGGASRSGALAYGHASGRDVPELLDSVRAHLEQGYRAIRVQTGVPGLASVYGVASSSAGGGERY
ncbi:bifunctional D-altronate/D-mannonate dehydratase, partial [Streptomyces javensis]|nr:bifunctional D-altronate/D-mannonate dehydratase [Streptomyces javensis]